MKKIIQTTGSHFEIALDENGNPVMVRVNAALVKGQMTKINIKNNLKIRKNGKK